MMNRIGIVVAILVAAAALLLAASYAWFVPLQTDGGWYSYPGYAMSQGRDPSENLLSPEVLARESQGIRATFGWENRSFLIVRLHEIWFSAVGTTLTSLAVFGVFQWLLVTALAAIAAWLATRSALASLIVALATMADSWLISESLADLRPDVPIAITACACVAAIIKYFARPRWYWLLTSCVLSLMLPLLHTTGVLAFVFCAALVGILAVSTAFTKGTMRLPLLLVVVCGVLGFFARQSIVDFIVPTSLSTAAELPYRHSLNEKLYGIIQMGLAAKLLAEIQRWKDYFLVSNIGQLLLIGLGAVGLVASIVRQRVTNTPYVLRLALLIAFVAAPVATVLDPHETPSHVVPLAVLGYIAAGVGICALLETARSRLFWHGLIALGLLVVLFKGAHIYLVVRDNASAGVSKRSVAAFVTQILDRGQGELAVAPTFLWPYVGEMRSVVLIDPGSRVWQPNDIRLQSVNTIILDRDFLARGWDALVRTLVKSGVLTSMGSLGVREGGFYLEAYALSGVRAMPLSKNGNTE